MNKQIINQKPFFGGMTKNVHSKESIYLNTVYDSAIVEINRVTRSVTYSLSKLITIEISDLHNYSYANRLINHDLLIQFLRENFSDFFSELQSMRGGIPPTLLWDLEQVPRLVA